MNESARKQNILTHLVSLHVFVELALPLDRLVDDLIRRLLDGPGAHPVPLLPHLPRLVDGLPSVGVLEDRYKVAHQDFTPEKCVGNTEVPS